MPDAVHRTASSSSERLVTPAFLLLTISGFFAMIGFSATLPLVPRFVEGQLDGGKVAVGIAVGIFSLSAVFARPWIGQLGDTRGRRFIIVLGTATTAATVAAHALADSLPALLFIRLLMGVTQGAFFVGSATLVNDLAPPARRGEATNLFSVAIYGGMALGPILGEVFQKRSGFSLAFVLSGASLAIASLLALALPNDRPDPSNAPTHDPSVPRVLIYRAAIPPGIILMGGLFTFTALNGFMPLYVEERGLGSAGPILGVYGLLVLIMRVLGSKLPDRFGTHTMTVVSLIGQMAGMLVMGLWASQAGLYAGAAVLAIGGSFLYPTLLTAAVYRVPDNERARATSTFTLAFELSAGIGGPFLGVAAAWFGTQAAFLGAALTAALVLPVLAVWSRERPEALVPPRPAG